MIYGWNGTGEAQLLPTSSAWSKNVSPSDRMAFRIFSIAYGTKTITPANIATDTSPPSIRVFNRAFVNNVFSESGASPIFFIGEENIEKQKELEKQRKELEKLKTDTDAKKKTRRKSNTVQF